MARPDPALPQGVEGAPALSALESLQPIGRAILDEPGAGAVGASPAIDGVRLNDDTGLAAIHQRLQAACQLLALVVRQLGQAVDQARHLLLSHGLLLGQTLGRHAWEMGAQRAC